MAYHLQQHADAIYEDLHQKMDMNIAPRVSVVIRDTDEDVINGLATLATQPIIMLTVNQNAPYELRSQGDTAQLILRHELVHIFAGRYYRDEAIPLLNFGYLPRSNFFAPNVFHEGYAQWYESDLAMGNGRALRHNPLGEGLWRQEYAEGFRDYTDVFEPVGLEEGILSYLYGAYFFTYVSERFGEQAITSWLKTRAQSGTLSFLNLSRNWEAAFAEPLAATWELFIQHESERFSQLLADLDATEFTTQQSGLSVYYYPNAILNTDSYQLYMDYRQGYGRARLILQQEGHASSLGRYDAEHITGDAKTAWFTQLDVCAKGEERYSLYRLTLATGEIDKVQPCGRIAQLAWNSDAQQLIVWRLHNGGSILELLDRDGNTLQTLTEFGYDAELATLAWHPGAPERVLVNLKPDSSANFNLYELNTEIQQWTQLTNNQHIYHDAHWHNDTTVVYSRKAGAFLQAFAWDTKQGTEHQLTRVTQNVLNPRWHADGQLDFVTESGFHYQRATTHVPQSPMLTQRKTLDAAPVSLVMPEAQATSGISHPYLPMEHMSPGLIVPLLGLNNVGALMLLTDPTMRHEISLTMMAGTRDVELKAEADYIYTRGNHAFGGIAARQATKDVHLSGYAFFYNNHTPLSYYQKVNGSLSVIGSQRLEGNAIETDHWLGLALDLENHESNFNRQRPNQVVRIGLEAESDISQMDHLRLQAHAGSYASLLRHHGIWLDAQAHYTTDADEPFQASTIADNSVIPRPIASGLGLLGLQASLADDLLFSGRSGLDISLTRPQHTLGSWGLGVQEVALRPYASAVTNFEGQARGNLGAEISTRFSALWMLPLEFSVGYAHDWDNLDNSKAGGWFFDLGPAL